MSIVRLGEVSSSVMGQAPPGKACNKEGVGTPFVKAGEFDERFPAIREWTTQPLKHARLGDVLICVVGATAGKINQGIECAIGRSVAAIRPDVRRLDSNYLYYFMRQKTDAMRSKSQGLAQGVITRDMIADIEIPLPPLDEQKRIAAILDQADELRRKRQRAIDRLNQLGQAIFHEMFGDPLGAPREGIEWITEALETNVEFMDYRGKTPLKADSGIRLITARNVKMGIINLEPQEFVEAESYDAWMTRGFPQKGDILFTTEAPLGHVAQLDTDDKVVIGQRLITMKPNLKLIRPTYLEFFLRTSAFRTKMFENSTGSTVVGIKSKLLKKIEIRYPSRIVQERFESAINQLRLTQPAFEKMAIRIDSLFASLQHRAFQGEL